MNKFLEGCEKLSDGRYRIRESLTLSKKDLVGIESSTITESASDSVKSYRFKIWSESDYNLNKRRYNKVMPIILREQPITLGMVNHPDDDLDEPDLTRTFSVQSKPMMENGWLTCQLDLVGEYGKLVEEILDKGGTIGVSSSCLGTVDSDGFIEPDNFVLERYADFVATPSNNYYHSKQEVVSEKVQESKEQLIDSNNTIILDKIESNNIKENTMTNEIKNLRLNLKNMIREADKSTKIDEKLGLLEEALNYCDGEDFKDLKDTITERVSKLNEAIKNKAKESVKLKESLKQKDTEVATVKESLTEKDTTIGKLKLVVETMKSGFNRNKIILEKQTELKLEESKKVSILESDIQELIAKNIILERDLQEALSLHEESDKKDSDEKEDDKDKDDEDKKEPKKDSDEKAKEDDKEDKKEESVLVNRRKVREFYMDSIKTNETLVEHKLDILSCETLKEAQELVLKLTNKVDLKESKGEFDKVTTKKSVKSASSITEKYRRNWNI